jgi:hypothetical protein
VVVSTGGDDDVEVAFRGGSGDRGPLRSFVSRSPGLTSSADVVQDVTLVAAVAILLVATGRMLAYDATASEARR